MEEGQLVVWDWLHTNRFWVMIGGLYVLKFLLLATVRPRDAGIVMGAVLLALQPVIWNTADWTNEHMWSPLAIYIGQPVGVLLIPVLSFLYDLRRKIRGIQQGRLTTILRLPAELLLVLAWAFVWGWAEFMFQWYWI